MEIFSSRQTTAKGKEAVTAPLQNMNRLVSPSHPLLAVVVGGIVLYLVLASQVGERMGESGILLSLGFLKGNILAHPNQRCSQAVLAFSFVGPCQWLGR